MDRLRETLREWGGTFATVAVVVGVIGLAGMIMLGGQTSGILNAVGSAVQPAGGQSNLGVGGGDVTADDPATDQGADGSGAAGGAAAAIALREESRLVYTGTLRLAVEDVTAAGEQARGLVAQAGAYLGGSRTSTADGSPVAELMFRIPSSEWASTLAALRGLATDMSRDRLEHRLARPEVLRACLEVLEQGLLGLQPLDLSHDREPDADAGEGLEDRH